MDRSRFRRLLRFLILAVLLAACTQRACSKDTGTTPNGGGGGEIPRAPMPLGYAAVHDWYLSGMGLCDQLAEEGLTLTQIEFTDSLPAGALDYGKAQMFVDRCRTRGIEVMVVAMNWNDLVLRGKDDDWFRGHVRAIRDRIGRGGVLFEPVAEPGGDARIEVEKANRWEQIGIEEWGTDGLILNSKGYPSIGGVDLVDWHFCDYDRLLQELAVNRPDHYYVTDCTALLGRTWTEEMTKEAATLALSKRAALLIYDTFTDPPRLDLIRWLGKVIKGP